MSQLSEYWMNTPPQIIQYDLLEITHSAFLSTIRIVRNAEAGLVVQHEDGPLEIGYKYIPMELAPLSATSDLTQAMGVTLGDLGSEVQNNIRSVTQQNKMGERPVVKYRTYLSSDLTTPLFGPATLEITDVSTTRDANSFEARAPKTNSSRTGEVYDTERFPMMAAFT